MSVSVSPFVGVIPPSFSAFYSDHSSGQQSRGESALELEALAAVHQFSIAVQSIAVSEMLPRTADLIFVNLTTLEGQPYCLELTATKGWRVTSLRCDCMQGDFTQMELFTAYYRTLDELMDVISPEYRERFAENFKRRLEILDHMSRHTSTDTLDFYSPCSCQSSDCSAEENEENANFSEPHNRRGRSSSRGSRSRSPNVRCQILEDHKSNDKMDCQCIVPN